MNCCYEVDYDFLHETEHGKCCLDDSHNDDKTDTIQ